MQGKLGHLSTSLEGAEAPNLTPLIDIVFILLIFFLVTTTFAKELGIDVDRPEASSALEQDARVIRVAIGSAGEVTVDATPTSGFRVEAEVRARLTREQRPVLVIADKRVPAESLVRVMDACRSAGAASVALAVEEQ